MLEPETLQAFVTIAAERHFVRAADVMGCAQSVVSKRLKRLEDQLGARLLSRHKRSRVELTREGIQFLPLAKHVLEELVKVEERGRRIALGELGSLRIGYVFSTIMTGLLPRLIRHLQLCLPGLEIVPTALGTPEQIVEISGDGRLDIGIVRPRPSYPVGVSATLIHKEKVVLAVPTDSPLVQLGKLRCADLANHSFIVPQFHEEVGLIDVISMIAKTGGFKMPTVIKTSDFITTAGLAAAGMGVAPVPASLAALSLDGLVYLPIEDLGSTMELVLLEAPDMPKLIRDVIARFPPNEGP